MKNMTKFTSALLACLLCSSAAFGFDPIGFIKKTVSDEGDITAGFDRNNRLGVVKDDVYKLMWQDSYGKDMSPLVIPSIEEQNSHDKLVTYAEAVRYCDDLNFAGFDDWRLPTANELLSITDDTRFNPAINKAFKNVAYETNDKGEKSYGLYWSSTGRADDSSRAWLVDFWFGGVGWNDVSNRGFVRCVRQY
ncbi:Lcl C-terminal domain-containing protein [Campylobacter rectus]